MLFWYNHFYICLNINVLPLWKQNSQQYDIFKEICQKAKTHFDEGIGYVAHVYGPSGTGKTSLGQLVAREMKGKICMNIDPTEPGVVIEELLSETKPCKDTPLILLFDEFNVWMVNAFHENIQTHPIAKSSIKNKCGNNTLLDLLSGFRGRYIISLFLSNPSPQEIIDAIQGEISPLRKRRIHDTYHLYEKI